jgi:hypothetical protein
VLTHPKGSSPGGRATKVPCFPNVKQAINSSPLPLGFTYWPPQISQKRVEYLKVLSRWSSLLPHPLLSLSVEPPKGSLTVEPAYASLTVEYLKVLMVEHLKVLISRAPCRVLARCGTSKKFLSLTVEPLPVLTIGMVSPYRSSPLPLLSLWSST